MFPSCSVMHSGATGRVWEVDFLRGAALVLMIVFHVFFDLKEFYGYPIEYNSGIIFYIGKASGILFITISAVSCFFSGNNTRRGLKILAVAGLITLVSHLYNPDYGIKFGILHLLGISILLYPWFKDRNKYILVILGTMVIILGQVLGPVPADNNYLFLFNLTSSTWVSADYYPMFPWFGVFLYGIVLGRAFYGRKMSLLRSTPRRDVFSFIGRHTLPVYLVHQPLLLLIIGLCVKLTK